MKHLNILQKTPIASTGGKNPGLQKNMI